MMRPPLEGAILHLPTIGPEASLEVGQFNSGGSCRCCDAAWSCRAVSDACVDVAESCTRPSCQWEFLLLESVSDFRSRKMGVNRFDFFLTQTLSLSFFCSAK